MSLFSEVKKVAKKHEKLHTQRERAELIFDLKVILETYKKYTAKLDKSSPLENVRARASLLTSKKRHLGSIFITLSALE